MIDKEKKLMKYADKRKDNYWKKIYKREQRNFENNALIYDFMDINKFKMGFKPQMDFCRSKEGNLTGSKEGVKKRWKEYFQELLNQSFGHETDDTEIQNTSIQTEGEVKLPTRAGVRIAAKYIKLEVELWKSECIIS
jgi:hypothetical protein